MSEDEAFQRGYTKGYHDGVNKVLDALDAIMCKHLADLRRGKIQGGQR